MVFSVQLDSANEDLIPKWLLRVLTDSLAEGSFLQGAISTGLNWGVGLLPL